MRDAIEIEGAAHRLLLAGDPAAAETFQRAAARYRESWELAPPRSFGRLIGMLKAQILAGDAEQAARYALHELPADADSPPSSYALAIAALVLGDDSAAAVAAEGMRGGSPPFDRAAEAIVALTSRDQQAYATAIAAIVADFEARPEHLTGVAIADTALMLERLAEPRGMAARPASPLVGG
jgi:hypothetical protein